MSKHRTVKLDRALKANVCEDAEQEEVMALFSPEYQQTIKKLKASLNGMSEVSRRIGICGSKILREINLNFNYPKDMLSNFECPYCTTYENELISNFYSTILEVKTAVYQCQSCFDLFDVPQEREILINPSCLVNARRELIDFLEQEQLGTNPAISWATLRKRVGDSDDFCFIDLVSQYTEQDYASFLDSLDFEYESNAGCSCQNLFGIVVLTDGTWIGRNTDTLLRNKLTREYFKDGRTERWQYHKLTRAN